MFLIKQVDIYYLIIPFGYTAFSYSQNFSWLRWFYQGHLDKLYTQMGKVDCFVIKLNLLLPCLVFSSIYIICALYSMAIVGSILSEDELAHPSLPILVYNLILT